MRVILYTGKGGVGKTTVAAATALRLAGDGRRVLAMSTDPAHSLGDSLRVRLGNEPTRVAENLDALEIDAMAENDKAWESLRTYLGRLVATGGTADLADQEMLLLPGLAELFSLLRVLDYAESDAYDVIVVDCAPTGETLSLLHYPERLNRLFATALPTKRAVLKAIGRPLEKLTKIPMPEDRMFDDVLALLDRLSRLSELVRNRQVLSLRIVTTPERIVVAEARRTYTWLAMYGYGVDAVVVNRIYPDAALHGYFEPWAATQAEGLRILEEGFAHLPLFRLELQPHEVLGVEVLRDIGAGLYGDRDPAEVFFAADPTRIVRVGDHVELRLYLPNADKRELDLRQDGTDVVVAFRNEQRRFGLPDSLVGREIESARYEGDHLVLALV